MREREGEREIETERETERERDRERERKAERERCFLRIDLGMSCEHELNDCMRLFIFAHNYVCASAARLQN